MRQAKCAAEYSSVSAVSGALDPPLNGCVIVFTFHRIASPHWSRRWRRNPIPVACLQMCAGCTHGVRSSPSADGWPKRSCWGGWECWGPPWNWQDALTWGREHRKTPGEDSLCDDAERLHKLNWQWCETPRLMGAKYRWSLVAVCVLTSI